MRYPFSRTSWPVSLSHTTRKQFIAISPPPTFFSLQLACPRCATSESPVSLGPVLPKQRPPPKEVPGTPTICRQNNTAVKRQTHHPTCSWLASSDTSF